MSVFPKLDFGNGGSQKILQSQQSYMLKMLIMSENVKHVNSVKHVAALNHVEDARDGMKVLFVS